ncbi:MAG: SDR family oxidoreductase [Candidatus Omnitrophota bacterium]|jgi:NAD(P)-dependent dehydrogenase (short-subunit alcohol dehydrogenase family)
MKTLDKFKLNGRIAIITGGAGFLGRRHAKAIGQAGGIPVLWDINKNAVVKAASELSRSYNIRAYGFAVDITDKACVADALSAVIRRFKKADILINNAARNPAVTKDDLPAHSRLESFDIDLWEKDICVGLTGAFICSQVVGAYFAGHGGGVILNIASDLGLIAPDQRIYRKKGIAEDTQAVKPVTYSVVKHGLIGLTKYCATYWANKNVRVNAISPGGVYRDQPEEFVKKLADLIPMGRMARADEYEAVVVFLTSDASSYMTGTNVVIDGGRTCW